MNDKNKSLIPIIIVIIMMICTVIFSINNREINSYIIDSYFPVWIFMLIIISQNIFLLNLYEKKVKGEYCGLFKMDRKKYILMSSLFLFIQMLISFISLWKVIRYSEILTALIIIFVFTVIGEFAIINLLYKNLEKIISYNEEKEDFKKIRKKFLFYITIYFIVYLMVTLVIAIDYYS